MTDKLASVKFIPKTFVALMFTCLKKVLIRSLSIDSNT